MHTKNEEGCEGNNSHQFPWLGQDVWGVILLEVSGDFPLLRASIILIWNRLSLDTTNHISPICSLALLVNNHCRREECGYQRTSSKKGIALVHVN